MEDHINVAIRVRPLNQREQRTVSSAAQASLPWSIQRDTITQRTYADGRMLSNGNSFTFGNHCYYIMVDKVFDQKDTTQRVYDDIVKNIITSSMGGFNGTIFAYGQTSSGKTHTMHGNCQEPGIIKLAVREIFNTVKNDTKREYLIRVSFLEIYNEVLRDLLEPAKCNLKIHENAKREIFVGDLSEHIVFNANHVEEILQKGDRNRHIAGTNMNERSSRSHTIFRIVIESREKAESEENGKSELVKQQQRLSTGSLAESEEFMGAVMVSCLNLVDLAGSERVGQTGAEGQRLKEGAHINKSLLALGTVIGRLSEDGSDYGHIPYRDSKLTRILQPSLGGNAKTLIICTITPSPDYIDEALSTLKFASRAKTIRNTPEVNEELRGDALLRRLKRASELEKEIEQMKEIERKKIKIEADNEALLRQLWKSQKERERLQRELEMQQSNVFLPHIVDGKANAGDSSMIRRQTWFPGLQGPVIGGVAEENRNISNSGDSKGMDIDNEVNMSRVAARARTSLPDESEQQQMSIANSNKESSQMTAPHQQRQQEHSDLTKRNQEMQSTLDQIMREYNLLLTTLTQLAEADVIPPSPARPGSEAQPRELVQIRRKLRALMTTIEASQRQCRKFRSQRPEAEFLELELQAVRETLAEKEDELVRVMCESDEVFSRLREAEATCSMVEQERQALQESLKEVQMAKDADSQRWRQERLELESQHQSLINSLRNDKQVAIKEAEIEREAHCAEIVKLQTAADQLQQNLSTLQRDMANQAQTAQTDVAAARAEADQALSRCTQLESQLAASNTTNSELAAKCDNISLAKSQLEAEARQTSERLQAEIDQLQKQQLAAQSEMSALHEQIANLYTAAENREHAAKQATELIQTQQAQIESLQLQLVQAEAERKALVDSHETRLRDNNAHAEQERLNAEKQLLEKHNDECAKLSAELGAIRIERTRAFAKIEQLEAQNADIWERVSELTSANSTLVSDAEENAVKHLERVSALENDIDVITGVRNELQQKLDKVTKDYETAVTNASTADSILQAKLKENIQDIEQLRSSLQQSQLLHNNADSTIEQLSTQLSQLTSDLHNITAQHEQTQQELETVRSEYAAIQLEQQHQAIANNEQLETMRSRERQACEQVQQLEHSLQAERDQLCKLQQALKDHELHKDALNASLTEELNSKSSVIAKLEKQVSSLIIELESARSEVTDWQQRVENEAKHWQDKATADLTEAQAVADNYKSRATRLEKQIAEELQPQICTLQSKLDVAQSTSINQTQQHETQVANLCENISKLEEQLKEQHAQIQSAEQAAADTQCRLQNQLDELHNKQQQANAALETVTKAKQVLEQRLAILSQDADRQLQSVQIQLDSALQDNQSLHDKLSKLEEERSAAPSISDMSAELNSLRAELDDKIEELQKTQHSMRQADAAAVEATRIRQQLETQVVQLQQTLKESHDAQLQLEYQAAEAVKANSDAQTKITKLAQELQCAQAAELESTDRAAKLDTEMQELNSKLASLSATAESHKTAHNQLKAQYDSLTERTRDAQAELEQALAAATSEINSKNIALADLEAALEQANASTEAARSEAGSQSSADIERLEANIASLESQLAESVEAVDELVQERDRAHASIDTLKDMMTELAQVKNDEIADIERQLEKQQALLEASISEGLQKDATIERLIAESAQLSEKASSSDAAHEQALAQSAQKVEALKRQNENLEKELSSARATTDKLQAEAAQRESDIEILHKKLEALQQSAPNLATMEQDADKLRSMVEKLERKNAKLRDVYTSDISELHAAEEKQRQRAESLSAELNATSQKTQDLASQLERAQQELVKFQQRSAELEAAVAKSRTTSTLSPATPNSSHRNKSAATRLASQRSTPIKQVSKRPHISAEDMTRSPVAMLSPVPPSKLNIRNSEPESSDGLPPRKHTAAETTTKISAANLKTANNVKSDTRSSYGDRRRNRRNQPAPARVGDGLDEQIADQCVQQ
ncbi:hypothetical protein IWW36_002239 [Coemansia brasiliensis]|uniref:Kinesin motor domain-containing protein n=1 Tax=Coemansia brasiliensis TaxID=2650707 RepID=A0A9W8LZL8_9FUNG|nr:hypothetical protein IWW36_002239 [Coemansia brasiliensis]